MATQQSKYDLLRATYPVFVYESFQYDVQADGLHIAFSFHAGKDVSFHPESVIPMRTFLRRNLSSDTLNTLVFNIGMAELVSYWKCVCSPLVEVRCGTLCADQCAFWQKLYFHGLGEFFYLNGITADESDFMTIHSSGPCWKKVDVALDADRYLVPIGGGKDSVVTLEALSDDGDDASSTGKEKVLPLIMNPRGATELCALRAGYPIEEVFVIRRTIDARLLELNAQGFLNGHTPFSALLAFYTLLASALTGRGRIALSNESSANESTVKGSDVNHQYSKSFEFENDFREYVSRFVGESFAYFSFLRPLSELQIALLFSGLTKYHDVFKSCNAGSKEDKWCGHCSKCLFAFIILSPFLSPETLQSIFGRNLLDDASLETYFRQLNGAETSKPFECVGTIDEVNSALAMTIARHYPTRESRPFLLRDYVSQPIRTSLTAFDEHHNLLPHEVKLLRTFLERNLNEQL